MTTSIRVTNSLCQIQNHPEEIHEELTDKLRYMDQSIEFSYRSNIRKIKKVNDLLSDNRISTDKQSLQKKLRHLLHVQEGIEDNLWISLYDEEGYFPTGLLPEVEQVLDKLDVKYEIVDERSKPEMEFKFVLKESFPPFRYYQKAGAEELQKDHRGVLVLPTGTGKSITAGRMIWDTGVKTLVVTPSKAITDHMTKTLIKHFGKGKVAKLKTKDRKTKAINVVNIQALVNMPPEMFNDIRMVIIDEFHHSSASTYLEVNEEHLKNCYYRIGLTATNFRNDGSEMALRSVLSNILYEYPIRQAIRDKNLMQPDFEVYSIQLEQEDTYQKAYKNQIVHNDERNEMIKELAVLNRDRSVIILVKQVEHGEILKKLLPHCEFIHGQTKDSERERLMENFRKGKLKGLIGTSVIGEGVDLPIADMLIMAGGGKSKIQVMQNIGRVLRLYPGKDRPLICDFTDEDGSWLEDHSLVRSEIYEEYLPEEEET